MFEYNFVDSFFQDDGDGNIQIVTSDLVNPKVVIPNAGKVNYKTGEINLINFSVGGFADGSGITIMVTTKLDDIKAPAGRIFLIKDLDTTVGMKEVK